MTAVRVCVLIGLGLGLAACGGGGGGDGDAAGDDSDDAASGGDDGGGGGDGLALLYAGPVADAVIPGWSASAPRPLMVEAYLASSSTWWVSIARIAPGGQVSEIIADEVRIWGWPDGDAAAPVELAAGPLATTRVPGWSASAPRPLVLGARQDGSQDWFVAIAKVHTDGALSELVADDIAIWGWPAGTGPTQEYDGPLATAAIAPWSAASPRPLIVLANQSQPEWFVSMVGIGPTGAVGGIVANTVEVWGF
jgi:hypothetical protein